MRERVVCRVKSSTLKERDFSTRGDSVHCRVISLSEREGGRERERERGRERERARVGVN